MFENHILLTFVYYLWFTICQILAYIETKTSMKILITGGCGYIGSHTFVDLLQHGFEAISIDNYTNSCPTMLKGIAQITHKTIQNYAIDLCDLAKLEKVFETHTDIVGIIHFAAYKSVPDSVKNPLKYYDNNLNSLINILKCIKKFNIPYHVFSSSCSVYGNATELPVHETTPCQIAQSPYAHTKQMGEEIIKHFTRAHSSQHVLLRYFNPVGAHPSALIGELQDRPQNLVPIITQTAIGKRTQMTVFGNDYDTRDGTCVRDYIHVMDIAHAHTKALQYLINQQNIHNAEIFNLGTGEGITVLEAIKAFEKVSKQQLNYKIGQRRAGDVVQVYADNQKARHHLQWHTQYTLEDMMETAWNWELKCRNDIHK